MYFGQIPCKVITGGKKGGERIRSRITSLADNESGPEDMAKRQIKSLNLVFYSVLKDIKKMLQHMKEQHE